MMDHKERVKAFIKLGEFFREYCEINNKDHFDPSKQAWHTKLNDVILLAGHKNGWFTKENIAYALNSWGDLLTKANLKLWLSNYDIAKNQHKTVALIMAGNTARITFARY